MYTYGISDAMSSYDIYAHRDVRQALQNVYYCGTDKLPIIQTFS